MLDPGQLIAVSAPHEFFQTLPRRPGRLSGCHRGGFSCAAPGLRGITAGRGSLHGGLNRCGQAQRGLVHSLAHRGLTPQLLSPGPGACPGLAFRGGGTQQPIGPACQRPGLLLGGA